MNARSRCLRAFSLVAMVAIGAAVWASAALASAGTSTYVVQLKAQGLASYTGGKQGLPATSPKVTDNDLDTQSNAAKKYRAMLNGVQSSVLDHLAQSTGSQPKVLYSYRTALAGFAAELTEEQALALRKSPDVAQVVKDSLLHPMAEDDQPVDPFAADYYLGGAHGDGASYLGLPKGKGEGQAKGLWQRLGGVEHAGEGVIVGVVDTGITPEHPSFSDNPADSQVWHARPYSYPEVWEGTCQGGEKFKTTDCNNKLIGARYFVDGFSVNRLAPESTVSPRDDDGHGSHTASTAAGNFGVRPSIAGNDLGVTFVSGMAPRAWVASYKVCWTGKGGADGCTDSDITAAIDAAVADGVDVINFSIGGDQSEIIGPMEIAFLGAADAGVFVANSAGNSGPEAGTVGSPTSVPWITSVGASTLARTFQSTATITGADGVKHEFNGASVMGALPSAPIVDGEKSVLPNVDASKGGFCLKDALDPEKVKGKIVICKRGTTARVEKGKVIKDLGAVGMILYNAKDAEDTVTDNHHLPAVHVSYSDGVAIKALAVDGTTAEISQGRVSALPRGGQMAAFSSRGPQTAVPDIPKPDVTAPGVNILAAAAPHTAGFGRQGELFQAISGTSMSGPHVAGLGALLKQLHPMFTPAQIKSSLMTTANPDVLKEDGKTKADPFDTGSGEVDPNRAADPGLVLDLGTFDYISYLKALLPDLPIEVPPTEPTDLNLPAISNSHVVGNMVTGRTFTSVDPKTTRWQVKVEGLKGIDSELSQDRFTIKPGKTQQIAMRFTVTEPLDGYAFGALILTAQDGSNRTVRLPISLKVKALEVASDVTIATDKASGKKVVPVTSGYTGKLASIAWGLVAPQKLSASVSKTSGLPSLKGDDAGTNVYPVTIAEGTQFFAASISNVDGGAGGADLDLYLFRKGAKDDLSDAELVGLSASDAAEEQMIEALPKAGQYYLAVTGFKVKSGGSTYDLSMWNANLPKGNSLDVKPGLKINTPVNVTSGKKSNLNLQWAGADEPGEYLGLVTYHNGVGEANLGNAKAYSIVHFTRTAAAGGAPVVAPPTGAPVGTPVTGGNAGSGAPVVPAKPAAPSVRPLPAGVAGPPAPAVAPSNNPKAAVAAAIAPNWLRQEVKSVRLSGRTLVIKLSGSKQANLSASISRGGKLVAQSKMRKMATQASDSAARLSLGRKLAPGRYVVKLVAKTSGRTTVHNVALTVR